MNRTLLAGGCSFTFGHELSDDRNGKKPSNKTWSALLAIASSADQVLLEGFFPFRSSDNSCPNVKLQPPANNVLFIYL